MSKKVVAYVVSDFRSHGRVVTGIYSGKNAYAAAQRWASETSKITRIFSTKVYLSLNVLTILPNRYA